MIQMKWIAAVLLASAALIGCHERPTVVREHAAGSGLHPTESHHVVAPGIVEPRGGEVRLAALEPGVISEVLVKEGEVVRAGALLARLEDSEARQNVVLAEADLRRARAELGRSAPGQEEVRLARAQAQARLLQEEQATREAKRVEALYKSGATTLSEFEATQSKLSVAKSVTEAANAELSLAARGAPPASRAVAQAEVQAAEARHEAARWALVRRAVKAPIDGVVLWSRYHVGEYYAPSVGPLFILGSKEGLQVRIEFNDVDEARLAPGASCQLRDDGGVSVGEGNLARVAPEFATRSLTTERPTDRSDGRVREGFVELTGSNKLSPGRRIWAYCGPAKQKRASL